MARTQALMIQIATGDPRPISKQIVDAVRMKIATGELEPGDQLPSVRGLAQQLTINPNTVAKAYAELATEGWLESRQGLGLYVATPRQRLSEAERERRLDDAIGRFINDVIALDYPPDEVQARLVVRISRPCAQEDRLTRPDSTPDARTNPETTMSDTTARPDSEYVIETRALSKRYGRKLALDHLDLRIPRGRIHAIVGANGAGKSTLFRILLGFLPPTAGEARILGRDSQQLTPADRSRIGFVNEEHTLPGWMRVSQVGAMQRRQYPRWNQRAYDEVIGHYHVLPEQKVGQLSRGERAGFNLALALAQSPELLVLDEPTLGLDVVAKRAFLESLMYSNAADDCTVIYCSHQMEEIERVADNLIILERGRLVNMSAPDDFCARVTHWVADVPFKGPEPAHRARPAGSAAPRRPAPLPGARPGRRLRTTSCAPVGARIVQSMPVSLDRAVNAFLAKNHAAPAAA